MRSCVWRVLSSRDMNLGGLHILFDLLDTKPSSEVQTEIWLLATQYCLDNEHLDQARDFLSKVTADHDVEQSHVFSGWYWQSRAVLSHCAQRLGESSQFFLKAKRQTPDDNHIRMGLIVSDEAFAISDITTA